MAAQISCPHCGSVDQSLITQISGRVNARTEDRVFFCEQCSKTWVVQALPLTPIEEPHGSA